ncbi:uncharacterized protein ELE39_001881 [Cryptosporidium sp. chipmunk genotype I]|uniref:uncharacterized protein n=1 Tax=Cryptosporidium sp. chipmunk genotype I TaxID=1280935 RepID=UPI00351A8E98|nr:hypothetical protein ELE39_001881 [Cryptosporidium sp. chipmunk genotype I]
MLYLLFGWEILGSMQEDMSEFSKNVLRICKDHRRLKQDQQTLLISWIDEILESKSVVFNTRYNLKKCRKSVRNILDGKATVRDKIVKFFFERRLRNYEEQCRKLTTARDPLSFRREELEELRKFTEETDPEPNSGLRLNDFYSSKFENETDNFLTNSFNLAEDFKSALIVDQPQDSMNDEAIETAKYILPYGSYSNYLDDDGIPLIKETEKFIFKHDTLLLLVPTNLPMHMSYVKMPLPQLEPQPKDIKIDYSITSMENQTGLIGELYKEESEQSTRSTNSVIEHEIVDERLDIFGSSESSSDMLSESEFIDFEPLSIKNALNGGKYRDRKRRKAESVPDKLNTSNNEEHIDFNDNGRDTEQSESPYEAQSIGDQKVESSLGSELSEEEEELSKYETSGSESEHSSTDGYYDVENNTDNSRESENLGDRSASETQDDNSERSSSNEDEYF